MSTQQVAEILKTFDTIHLEEMDSVKLMDRIDTKFCFSVQDLLRILPELAKDYRVLDVNGNLLSAYESLYYDSDNFQFYIDHHRKKMNRFKVRFRKYINSNIAFLEVKHKVNGRTIKSRIPSKGLDTEFSEDQKTFINNLGIKADSIKPVLTNYFERITLVHNSLPERVTLDLELSFDNNGEKLTFNNAVIAELKQPKVNRNSSFYSLMKKNLIRPSRISKYCVGIINVYGKEKIKYNRFKKKLLQLNKLDKHVA